MEHFDYDLLVVGSGPGGQSAALQAAGLGKRVGLVERKPGDFTRLAERLARETADTEPDCD